jgi:hypothetical protein
MVTFNKNTKIFLGVSACVGIMFIVFASIFVLIDTFTKKDSYEYYLNLKKINPYGNTHKVCSDNVTLFVAYYNFSRESTLCSHYCSETVNRGCIQYDKKSVNCIIIKTVNFDERKINQVSFNQCFKSIDWLDIGDIGLTNTRYIYHSLIYFSYVLGLFFIIGVGCVIIAIIIKQAFEKKTNTEEFDSLNQKISYSTL